MSSLKGVWAAVWGLLVEDGSLAIAIVLALGATWLAAALLPESVRDQVGWLLLAMLIVLVVLNLRATGHRARGGVASRR